MNTDDKFSRCFLFLFLLFVFLQKSLCNAMITGGVQLVELDLSDNAFGPIGAEGIEKFLESPAAYSLQVLKLNNNGLGAGGKVSDHIGLERFQKCLGAYCRIEDCLRLE